MSTDKDCIEAEVVGFAGDRLYLMPTGDVHGLKPNARSCRAAAGDRARRQPLLGRIIDGACNPLDGLGRIECDASVRLTGTPINPLRRQPITQPLDVGVRAINGLLTVGRGQRIGLFAGSGVGKSVLLGMMARYTAADVIVVGLIGERGREVKEFVERILGRAGLSRSVVVADARRYPPLMRLHGAWLATAIAEYFRDRGRNVLLIMDSLTRFAQAQREIALAIGEAPATKGYPPSVFARLPQLVERAGNGMPGPAPLRPSIPCWPKATTRTTRSSMPRAPFSTATSCCRAASPRAAAIRRSTSSLGQPRHARHRAGEPAGTGAPLRQTSGDLEKNRDLITIGAYQRGSDPRIDDAIARWPQIEGSCARTCTSGWIWPPASLRWPRPWQRHRQLPPSLQQGA